MSLELEVAVLALLKFTCDQSTQSVVYVQDTDVMPDFFQLERFQFISLTVQFKRP